VTAGQEKLGKQNRMEEIKENTHFSPTSRRRRGVGPVGGGKEIVGKKVAFYKVPSPTEKNQKPVWF